MASLWIDGGRQQDGGLQSRGDDTWQPRGTHGESGLTMRWMPCQSVDEGRETETRHERRGEQTMFDR